MITVTFKVNGQDFVLETDNILESLRFFTLSDTIKTITTLSVEYEGKTFTKMFRIMQMRLLLANDLRKQILAKRINQSLGITVQSYV